MQLMMMILDINCALENNSTSLENKINNGRNHEYFGDHMVCDGITTMVTEVGILEYFPEFVNLSEQNKKKFLARINELFKTNNISTKDIRIVYADEKSLVFQVDFKGAIITVRMSKNRLSLDSSIFNMSKQELDDVTGLIQTQLETAGKSLKVPLVVAESRLEKAGFKTVSTKTKAGKKIVKMKVNEKYLKIIQKQQQLRR